MSYNKCGTKLRPKKVGSKKIEMERIPNYLWEHGWQQAYEPEDLDEKFLLLDWLAVNRVVGSKRPIKTRQLFVYGEPSTQKTLLIRMLQQALKVYTTGERKSDYSGADDFHDLWVLDEFQDHVAEKTLYEEKPGAYLNHLLKLLDGQRCRLDAKYERVFLKKKNVPIMKRNKGKDLPYLFRKTGPWAERIFPLKFHSHLKRIEEERIVSTAEWGGAYERERLFSRPRGAHHWTRTSFE